MVLMPKCRLRHTRAPLRSGSSLQLRLTLRPCPCSAAQLWQHTGDVWPRAAPAPLRHRRLTGRGGGSDSGPYPRACTELWTHTVHRRACRRQRMCRHPQIWLLPCNGTETFKGVFGMEASQGDLETSSSSVNLLLNICMLTFSA